MYHWLVSQCSVLIKDDHLVIDSRSQAYTTDELKELLYYHVYVNNDDDDFDGPVSVDEKIIYVEKILSTVCDGSLIFASNLLGNGQCCRPYIYSSKELKNITVPVITAIVH